MCEKRARRRVGKPKRGHLSVYLAAVVMVNEGRRKEVGGGGSSYIVPERAMMLLRLVDLQKESERKKQNTQSFMEQCNAVWPTLSNHTSSYLSISLFFCVFFIFLWLLIYACVDPFIPPRLKTTEKYVVAFRLHEPLLLLPFLSCTRYF